MKLLPETFGTPVAKQSTGLQVGNLAGAVPVSSRRHFPFLQCTEKVLTIWRVTCTEGRQKIRNGAMRIDAFLPQSADDSFFKMKHAQSSFCSWAQDARESALAWPGVAAHDERFERGSIQQLFGCVCKILGLR